jgi:hypothetical protein
LGTVFRPLIAVGMATVLMTNPPGLSLAVIGNPRCRSTMKERTMPKRSTKRRAARAAAAARSATRKRRRRTRRARQPRRTTPAAAAAPAAGRSAMAGTARSNPSRKYWRVSKRIPWKNPGAAVAGGRRRTRRRSVSNGGGSGTSLMGDFAGLGAALADIGTGPMGLAWAAGGAAATAIGGNLVAAQVAWLLPSLGAGMGRMLNAAVFAGVAVGASRLARNPTQRRQLLAGGLAVAAIELLSPGKSYDAVAKVPVLNRLLPAPPIGADPAVLLAMQRRAAPGMAGVGGIDDGTDLGVVEPVAIDGVADVGDADDAGDGTGTGAGDSRMGELVPTYLNGLGCPIGGRSNDLTKLVTP